MVYMAINAVAGSIREFSPKDIDQVYRIAQESLTEFYTQSLIMDLHREWPESFMVYTITDTVVGFIVGSKYSRTEARILLFAVDERFRKMGVGSALMDRFLQLCREENMLSVRLEVRTDNDEAIRFYKKYGFVITALLPGYYSDSSNAYTMWRIV
ncbi:N-terminal acetyltransferase complex ard1 subunit related protein [Thermoplasma acidophilum]|uniref:N-terminal acetyltransferase complex ard1 subunit related protein n=2 Tax=Thermoplasma acidophilum TaxID=2303 RepID=Q9HM13_THEAC|nr:N-terminal acetyltransferase complex ard1 subunit related protein [Thermoplasma acidophilum]